MIITRILSSKEQASVRLQFEIAFELLLNFSPYVYLLKLNINKFDWIVLL